MDSQSNHSVGDSTTDAESISQQQNVQTLSDGECELQDVQTISDGETEPPLTEAQYLDLLKSREKSEVWEHYNRKMVNGRVKAICKYCLKKEYIADPNSGTKI